VWKREPALDRETVDDVIQFLMQIDEKGEAVLTILRGEDEEEADA
jgi:hypothetical protein